MPTTRSRAALTAALAVATLAGLAGCGAGSTATTPAAAPVQLPLVTAGTLTVATDATYAPMESMEGSKFVGADVDLVTDLAARLGLEVVFVQTSFDDLIDTVAGHRADLVASSMTDRASRQEQVDFVDYFIAGSQAVVAGGNPHGLDGPGTWCGRTAAVNLGTTNGDLVLAQSALCTGSGEAPVAVVEVPNGKSADVVAAGRADFGVEDYPSAAALADASGGTLALAGRPLQAAPYGLAFAKDRTDLRDAVQRALQESIASGRYAEILQAHGVEAAALTTTALNGGA
ncbi:ABC transporter substrate-binding protein [Kineococcus sp. SYSU DK002]|uniref:ABC transporter substrate-binding protein n=1 Tax=Kineococcus sp. SYSU DK002 TaxID=3383123 RepID=UPI003D7CD957